VVGFGKDFPFPLTAGFALPIGPRTPLFYQVGRLWVS
jgi:hypothetical protein